MRTYILTEPERKMVRTFLETGVRLDGFAVLKYEMKTNLKNLETDLELVKKLLVKVDEL